MSPSPAIREAVERTFVRRARAAARPDPGAQHPPIGVSGRPIRTVDGVDVEQLAARRGPDGTEYLTTFSFPVPGEPQWAIVQMSLDDGSRWVVGLGGWQHDEFPTMQAAMHAVLDPASRQRMRSRTVALQRIYALEGQARELRDRMPRPPEGALAEPDPADLAQLLADRWTATS